MKAEDFLNQGIVPVKETSSYADMSAESFLDMPEAVEPRGSGYTGEWGEKERERRTLGGTSADVAISAGKGVVGLGEAAVGLADIPTFGRVGKGMEEYLGYDPAATQEFLGKFYSPTQKEAFRKVEAAEGFLGTAGTMLRHPSTIGHAVVESAPQMLGGAAAARKLIASGLLKMTPVWKSIIAASVGEGLVSAGSTAEGIRQQTKDGVLTLKQAAIPVISGAGTALFAVVGGRVAQKFGIIDPDLFLAGGSNVTSTGIIKRIIGGGITEGAFEELPQSMQEQVWLNAALDKPLLEDVGEAGATGTLTGFAMGAGFNIFTGTPISVPTEDITPTEPTAPTKARAGLDREGMLNNIKADLESGKITADDVVEFARLPEAEGIVDDLKSLVPDLRPVLNDIISEKVKAEINKEMEDADARGVLLGEDRDITAKELLTGKRGKALTSEELITERAKVFEGTPQSSAEISAEAFEKEITEAEKIRAKAEIEPDINKFLKRGYEPYHISTAVEITEGKGIPTTPDQKRLLKGMTVEQAQESAKLWNEIWGVTTKKAEKEARIAEALTLIKERPDLFNAKMFAPEIKEKLALPPGQGFELKPTTKLHKTPALKPYEADVTYKPILSKSGKPFRSMAWANRVLKSKGLNPTEYTIIEHEDGFAIQRFGRKIKPAPTEPKTDVALELEGVEIPTFKSTQEAYAFGEKATPEQVDGLKRLSNIQNVEYEKFKKAGKLQEAMDAAVKGQFYHEALQKVEGTEEYKKFKPEKAVAGEKVEKETPGSNRSPEINAIRVTKTKDTKSYADIKDIDPNEIIIIYRAVPADTKGKIEAGDFVAQDREVAKFYANDLLQRKVTDEVKMLSKKIKASEIRLHPDHQAHGVENEFIYNPEAAKPQPSKLPKAKPSEAVTEEIKGEVIPEPTPKVEKEKIEVTPEKKELWELDRKEITEQIAVPFDELSPVAKTKALKFAKEKKLGHPSEYTLDKEGNYIDEFDDFEKALENGKFLKSLKDYRITPEKAYSILDSFSKDIKKYPEIQQEALSQIVKTKSLAKHKNYQGKMVEKGDTIQYGMFGDTGELAHISKDGKGIIRGKKGELSDVGDTYRPLELEKPTGVKEPARVRDEKAFATKEVLDWSPLVNKQLFDLDVAASANRLSTKQLSEFKRFLRENRNKLVRLYHATDAKIAILQEGLKPTGRKTATSLGTTFGRVSLGYDPRQVTQFPDLGYPYAKKINVYAVDIPIRDLIPDRDQLRNVRLYKKQDVGKSLAESLIYGGGAQVKGKILPSQIKLFSVYDKTTKETKQFAATVTIKPQDTITRADLKEIFSKMKNVMTGQDKDGNFYFKTLGRPKVTIYTVDHIEGYINTSTGRIPVGSFLPGKMELKTEGVGPTADVGSLWHEFFHGLKRDGIISNNDNEALNRAIAKIKGIDEKSITEEDQAYYVGDTLLDWHNQKNLRIKRILKKIADFVNSIWEFVSRTRTARGVLADIETGKILKESLHPEIQDMLSVIPHKLLSKTPQDFLEKYVFTKLFPKTKIITKDQPFVRKGIRAIHDPILNRIEISAKNIKSISGFFAHEVGHRVFDSLPEQAKTYFINKFGRDGLKIQWRGIEIAPKFKAKAKTEEWFANEFMKYSLERANKKIPEELKIIPEVHPEVVVLLDSLFAKKAINYMDIRDDYFNKYNKELDVFHPIRKFEEILKGFGITKVGSQGVNQFAQDVAFSLKKAAKAVTDNPNFVKWFGDTEHHLLAEEDGEPRIMYRGMSQRDFDTGVVDSRKKGAAVAGYFTNLPEGAQQYANRILEGDGVVKEFYVAAENVFNDRELTSLDEAEQKFIEKETGQTIDDLDNDVLPENKKFIKALKELGYDAIETEGNYPHTEICPFESTQIKSIYNTGTYSLTEKDIMYQMMAKEFGVSEKLLRKEFDQTKKKYEGTDKWLKAPNGKDSNLNEHLWVITKTPRFIKWFGDSQVLDENGEPLIVYHGTPEGEFNTFDPLMIEAASVDPSSHLGFYFIANKNLARIFSTSEVVHRETAKQKPTIMSVFLAIKNPLEINAKDFFDMIHPVEKIEEYISPFRSKVEMLIDEAVVIDDGMVANDLEHVSQEALDAVYEYEEALDSVPTKVMKTKEYFQRMQKDAISKGHDGIKILADEDLSEEAPEFGTDNYIAFKPTQIKSIYNTGSFSQTDPDIRYQMAGVSAIGAPTGQLVKAQEMLAEGKDKKEVWQETGWIKTPDNHWKFEIDDSGAELTLEKYSMAKEKTSLGDILVHDELYKAYPQIKETGVFFDPKETGGSFDKGTDTITIGTKNGKYEDRIKDVLFHEIQHAIQEIEGFARGGSPKAMKTMENVAILAKGALAIKKKAISDSISEQKAMSLLKSEGASFTNDMLFSAQGNDIASIRKIAKGWTGLTPQEAYEHLLGEIEARDTSARAKLTPKQRREQMPYESQGIPESQWIVTDGEGTSFSVEEKVPEKMYHGTLSEFQEFDRGDDIGIHFGTKEQAQDRLAFKTKGKKGGRVIEATVNLKNPLNLEEDANDWSNPDMVLSTLKSALEEAPANFYNFTDKELSKLKTIDEIRNFLQEKGYDGIVYRNYGEAKGLHEGATEEAIEREMEENYSTIVFDKAQISVEEQKAFSVKGGKDYKAMLKKYQEAHTTPAEKVKQAKKSAKDYVKDFTVDYIKVLDRYEAKLKSAETKLEKIKTSKEILKRRRGFIRAAADYFNLSDKELRQISGKDIRFMNNFEFKQYIDGIRIKAEKFEVRRQAMNELMTQIRDKELNVENLRKAMKLPTLKNMTVAQIQHLDETLAPFQKGDEFLTVRKLEVVDRTELKGIKTWREAREHLAKEISKQEGRTVTVEELQNIKVSEFDRFRYDTGLAEKDPFYKMMIEKPAERILISETEYLKMEQEVFALAKKIKGKGFFVPQYKNIVRWMEAPVEEKANIKLSSEEMALAEYMTEKNLVSMDYLIQMEAMRMGKQNYFTHVRRGILEAVKEDGIISAVKEQFKAYKLDEQGFNILDRSTGEVLAYDKWFKFAMHRTGELKPTQNVVKAFLTYQRTFLKKQALDETTPLIDIYAHALTPKGMTKKGLLLHGNLIKFVKEWINTQKGRHITLIAKQNGKIDAALRAIKMFTSLRDLAFNIPVSVATEVGEQITTYQLLGKRQFFRGKIRQNTKQGKKIIEKYRNLIGKNPWKELAEPSKAIGERLMEGIFVLFKDASVRSNKTFLLGSLSKTEFKSGIVSNERLAALRTELGRYRMVGGMKSIIGATPEGKAYTQYKRWAIPILRTTIQNLGNLGKKITFQKVDSKAFKKSAIEVYRLAEITALVMLMFGMVRDEDDNSFTGKIINKAYREATTLIQALQPSMFLTAGRTASFVEKLGVSLTLILQGEKYKTTDEYKGIKKLKRQFTPVAVSQFSGGGAGDLWDRRLRKHKAKLNKIKDDFDKAKDKATFQNKHREELRALRRANELQGELNEYRKRINRIKSRKKTKAGKLEIQRLEKRRTAKIKNHLKRY